MATTMFDPLYYPPMGTPKNRLPTPALLISLPDLEFNLSLMSGFYCNKSTKLRPHFKTHKCPVIAKKQIELGAIGITCAKLSEAEVLVNAGISNILIANQVVAPEKISRLAALAGSCQLIVAVDQYDNLEKIAKAAASIGNTVHVVIEVDVGLHRAGVQPGKPALELARKAVNLQGIHFSGLLGYEGFSKFDVDCDVRSQHAQAAMKALMDSASLIQRDGIPIEMISAGGTPTYDLIGRVPGVTEVEAGSYVFMDSSYNRIGLDFKQSLTLLAMVTSIQGANQCIIDAGLKVLATDHGLPKISIPDDLILIKMNEEHGIIEYDPSNAHPEVGMCIEIIPSHACTTVNLHDRYYVIQDDKLVDIWEISARGKSQ